MEALKDNIQFAMADWLAAVMVGDKYTKTKAKRRCKQYMKTQYVPEIRIEDMSILPNQVRNCVERHNRECRELDSIAVYIPSLPEAGQSIARKKVEKLRNQHIEIINMLDATA